ncbi:hypothetical protein Tco_0422336 [Tanacetum coccineum]
MVFKDDSGSKIDLEEIQESADEEPIVNTNTQQEVVTHVKPDDISLPIRRTSGRVSKPPRFYYGFHIEEDKISNSRLSKLDKPANYKEAMASPEASKLLVARISASMRKSHSLDFLEAKMRNDIPTLQSVKDYLRKCFAMKDLGDATYILGIKIYRDSMVSRHQQNPGEGHWIVVKNILKYLRNTKDRFLVYGGEEKLRVTGYYDASWQTDKDDSRSQSEEGHMIVKDIRSEDNPADPFTKALAKSRHDEHARSIGLNDKIKF